MKDLETLKKSAGAGIIIYFDNRGIISPLVEGLEQDILYLFLKDLNDKFDFPKGTIDFGEDEYSCAIREVKEEINILVNTDYILIDKQGKLFNDKTEDVMYTLKMFVGEIKRDSLSKLLIKENPHTSIKEHKDFFLLSKEKGEGKLSYYLKNPLDWANSIVLEYIDEDIEY